MSAGLDLILWKTWSFEKTKTAMMSWCRPCVRCVQRSLPLARLCAHVPTLQLLHYCFSQLPPSKKENCKHKQHTTTNICGQCVHLLLLIRLEGGWEIPIYLRAYSIRLRARLFRWVCGIFVFTATCKVESIIHILQIDRVVKKFVQGFSLLKLVIETRSYDSEILAHCWWGPMTPLPFLPLWWFRGTVRPLCLWA